MGSQDRSTAGKVIGIWCRHEVWVRLAALARKNGISRNAMVTKLVEDAEQP